MNKTKIGDMEGIDAFAFFLGAWVKYAVLMLFVVLSSFLHIYKKLKKKKE